jgi:hypothetical protein
MNRLVSIILLLAALAARLAFGQAQHPAGHGDGPPQPAKKADDLDELKGLTMESIQKEGKVQEIAPGTVQISPERQQLIGVRYGTVQKRMLDKVIRTVGRIEYDEKRIGIVSPKIGGWIEELYVDFTGRFVRKGEPLLTIYSPELVSTQEEYLLALKSKQDWSKSPFAEASEGGNFLADSVRRRLKLWDISDAQIKALEESREPRKTLILYSPFTGYVLEKWSTRADSWMPACHFTRSPTSRWSGSSPTSTNTNCRSSGWDKLPPFSLPTTPVKISPQSYLHLSPLTLKPGPPRSGSVCQPEGQTQAGNVRQRGYHGACGRQTGGPRGASHRYRGSQAGHVGQGLRLSRTP